MIRQQIDALKLLKNFHGIMQGDDELPRFSMLDAITLLLINDHPNSSKSDLSEVLFGARNLKKSSFDRPLMRLIDYGLIVAEMTASAATKSGESRVTYTLSKDGEAFLRKCAA